MRAAITACNVLGTLTSGTRVRRTDSTRGRPTRHIALGQVANDLFGEERIARAARSAIMIGETRSTDRSLPSSSVAQWRHLRIIQRLKRDRLRPRRVGKRADVFRAVGDQHQ